MDKPVWVVSGGNVDGWDAVVEPAAQDRGS
jgi:hypothetical protein